MSRVYMKSANSRIDFPQTICVYLRALGGNGNFWCCFSQSGKCRGAQATVIIHKSPFFFHGYLSAKIELQNVAGVIKHVQLKKNMWTSKVQEAHVEMSCQIESHVNSVDLCDPNLHFDPFTIPQINSSELEIFMSLRGEKCPWDRADFVSLGIKILVSLCVLSAKEKAPSPRTARRT